MFKVAIRFASMTKLTKRVLKHKTLYKEKMKFHATATESTDFNPWNIL